MLVSGIISSPELVAREKANLQKGMNFGIRKAYSIILMSVQRGTPYHDRLDVLLCRRLPRERVAHVLRWELIRSGLTVRRLGMRV